MRFEELDLHPDIMRGLADAGYLTPTPVQEKTIIETVKHGRDVTVQSQTGTGKTGAFLLSAFQLMLASEKFKGAKTMILAPTRELAIQINEEAKLLGVHLPLKCGCVYGGTGYAQQEAMLKQGLDVLVGTPGRLLDFVNSKKINPKDYSILIIDEADRLLDMGFFPDIKKLLKMLKPREERATFLLSATISSRVSQLTWEYMNHPADIVIESENITVDAIDQTLYHVSREEKVPILLGLLARDKPTTAIVFCNTKRAAEEVAKRLEINGYPANYIMGDLPQSKRVKIIQELKDGKVGILVATDVAARGLHVDALDMVINFDLPDDAENYVHRIGRTARAGAKGRSVSLACERYVYNLESIQKYINTKIPMGSFTDGMIVVDKSAGMRIRLDAWDDDSDRPPRRSDAPRGRSDGNRGGPRSGARRPDERKPDERRDQSAATAPRPAKEVETTRRPDEHKPGEHGAGERRRPGTSRKPADHERKPIAASARPAQPKAAHPAAGGRTAASGSLEDRLAYYRKKYGDSFQLTPEMIEQFKREEASGRKDKRHEPRRKPAQDKDRQHGTPRANPAPAKAAERKDDAQKTAPGGVVGWLKRLFRGS